LAQAQGACSPLPRVVARAGDWLGGRVAGENAQTQRSLT